MFITQTPLLYPYQDAGTRSHDPLIEAIILYHLPLSVLPFRLFLPPRMHQSQTNEHDVKIVHGFFWFVGIIACLIYFAYTEQQVLYT